MSDEQDSVHEGSITTSVDMLLRLYENNWTQSRQSESQRSTLTNLIIITASIILGFVIQIGLSIDSLPLVILLSLLGMFGAISSQKLYERSLYHVTRAKGWRDQAAEIAGVDIRERIEDADDRHFKVFPRTRWIRLHILWVTFNLIVATIGIILTILIITSY